MNYYHLIITLDGGPFSNPAFPTEQAARDYALGLIAYGEFYGSPIIWTYNPNVGLGTWYGDHPTDDELRVIFLGIIP